MSESGVATFGTPFLTHSSVTPNRAQNIAALRGSEARITASPGVAAITALARFTRPQRSRRWRSASRSSASRESSGRPLVTSRSENRAPRTGCHGSAKSSAVSRRATYASARVREWTAKDAAVDAGALFDRKAWQYTRPLKQ